eukprot:1154419-Pelagomonas_calceolata.AAC.2
MFSNQRIDSILSDRHACGSNKAYNLPEGKLLLSSAAYFPSLIIVPVKWGSLLVTPLDSLLSPTPAESYQVVWLKEILAAWNNHGHIKCAVTVIQPETVLIRPISFPGNPSVSRVKSNIPDCFYLDLPVETIAINDQDGHH